MPDSLHKPLQFLPACKTMMQQHNYYFDPNIADSEVQEVWLRFRQIYNYGEDCYLPYANPLGEYEESELPPDDNAFKMFLFEGADLCTMTGFPDYGTLSVPEIGDVLAGFFKLTSPYTSVKFKLDTSIENPEPTGFGIYATANPLVLGAVTPALRDSGGGLIEYGRAYFEESVPTENGLPGAVLLHLSSVDENGNCTLSLEVPDQSEPIETSLYAPSSNWLTIEHSGSEMILYVNGVELYRTPKIAGETWYTVFSLTPPAVRQSAGATLVYELRQQMG